jgi:hypothetical protein
MAQNNITDVVAQLIESLTPLSSDDRQRAISATLVLLGERPVAANRSRSEEILIHSDNDLPQRAQLWAKQNQLDFDTIEQVFHIKGSEVSFIAHEVPGKNGKEKTLNAYILAGIARFLSSGEPLFDDNLARTLCRNIGCYNNANHALYLKNKGNEMSGSKEKGWILTTPGLKRGATLVKELATK